MPRALRLGVKERMRADGRIETPLDRASLDAAIAELKAPASKRSLSAICTPGTIRGTNAKQPRHSPMRCRCVCVTVIGRVSADQGVRARLDDGGERLCRPGAVALSRRLEQRLIEAGYRGPILIIQSHGGVAPIAEAARLAAGACCPARGGVAGSRYAAELLGSGT